MNHRFQRHNKYDGFTLTELLVTISIGSVVVIVAAQSLIAHIRLSARQEALMRSQDTWSRIQNLIDQDIQESRCASVDSVARKLSLSMTTWCGDTVDGNQIIYQLKNNNLIRTGPPIDPTSGSLDTTSTSTTTIVSGNISEFSPSLNSKGNYGVTYSINILDPSGFTFRKTKLTGGHLRSRVIN